MSEIKIDALEKQVAICFNMAVQIAYEQITGKPFNLESINNATDTMALVYASIATANPETDITFDDLIQKASLQDVTALKTALFSAIETWCGIPPTLSVQHKAEGDEGKNSSAPATPTD